MTGPLYDALGRCILSWAQVEFELNLAVVALSSGSTFISRTWNRIKSFEAKVQVASDIAGASLTSDQEKRDWRLIQETVLKLYRLRNKAAHSTLTTTGGVSSVRPFLTLDNLAAESLSPADLIKFMEQFNELRDCIRWFHFRLRNQQIGHQQWPELEPDLMRRLRTEDDRKREAQRHRALAVRQYLDRNPDLKDILK